MKNLTIRDIERMEKEEEKLSGKSYMESLYGFPFGSRSKQTPNNTISDQSVRQKVTNPLKQEQEKSLKSDFIMSLTIGLLILLASVILHLMGLL